jgi:hypothetical protein
VQPPLRINRVTDVTNARTQRVFSMLDDQRIEKIYIVV